jgi:hypothetical protein
MSHSRDRQTARTDFLHNIVMIHPQQTSTALHRTPHKKQKLRSGKDSYRDNRKNIIMASRNRYKSNIMQRLGGENMFDFIILDLVENLKNDPKLETFFQLHNGQSVETTSFQQGLPCP